MRTDHLHYLLEVVKCQSINHASRKLFLNPQHLSRILTSAEEEIGTILFKRTRTGVILTEHGKLVIDKLTAMDALYTEVLQTFQSDREQKQFEAMTGTYYLYSTYDINPTASLQAIERLHQIFPNITILFYEKNSAATIEMVSQDPNSLGLFLTIPEFSIPNMTYNDNVICQVLYTVHSAVLVSPNSPLVGKYKTISLTSLVKEPFVIYDPASQLNENMVYQILSSVGQPNVRYCCSNLSVFYTLLAKGDCISLGVTKSNARRHKDNIIVIPVREKVKVNMNIAINKKSANSPVIQKLIEILRQCYLD